MRDDSYLERETSVDSPAKRWRSTAATAVGALMSLAILAAVVTWSYRLGVRDADDIPVIRAQAGPTKMRPEEPGGLEVAFQDRKVYEAVTGSPSAPAPRGLAPPPEGLAKEDVAPIEVSPDPVPRPDAAPETPPAAVETARKEPEAATPEAQPKTETKPEATPAQPAEEDQETALIQDAVNAVLAEAGASAEGETDADDGDNAPQFAPRAEPRPSRTSARPVSAEAAEASEPREAAAASQVQIQLGAFESEEVAAAEWRKIISRNGDLLSGRGRVITTVQSGGRTFFRLRAGPFESVAEASSLCRGLKARNEACIVARAQ